MTSFLLHYFSTISTHEYQYTTVQDAVTLSYFVTFLIYIIQLVICTTVHQVCTMDFLGMGTS